MVIGHWQLAIRVPTKSTLDTLRCPAHPPFTGARTHDICGHAPTAAGFSSPLGPLPCSGPLGHPWQPRLDPRVSRPLGGRIRPRLFRCRASEETRRRLPQIQLQRRPSGDAPAGRRLLQLQLRPPNHQHRHQLRCPRRNHQSLPHRTPRIEVHCWVVSHYIWSADKPPPQPGHIFNRHPEYLSKDSIGQKYIGKGYFLDPGHPDANQAVYNVARDIVSRYDIDGFHWDYCRYPTQDSGYNDTAIKRFNEEFGLQGEPLPSDPKFCEWRRRQVTDFLRWATADLWEIKPSLVISASAFSNIKDSYGYRLADWPAWNKEGIVDVCMPMDFSPDNRAVFFPRADEALKNQGTRHVYIGQGAYMNTQENTLTQLEYIRQKGFPGTVFYDYRHPNQGKLDQDGVFAFLKERFQPEWVQPPAMPWKKTKGIIKGTVIRAGTGTPVYNAVITLSTDPTRVQKTEPHGKFAFFDVSPGTYNVRAMFHGADSAEQTVGFEPGQVVNLTFALPP